MNDGRVQRLEIEHEDVGVVQALLRFEHQTTGVGRSLLLVTALFVTVRRGDATTLLGAQTVRHDVLARVEFVKQEVLDALRARVSERLAPQVTGDVGQLLRQRHDFHFKHEL